MPPESGAAAAAELESKVPAEPEPTSGSAAPTASVPPQSGASAPLLKGVRRDLIAAARKGELDPVLGRAFEVRRLMQILTLKARNNPLLVGDHGVGTTAVVHGLAQTLAREEVPRWFDGKRIYAFDLDLLLGSAHDQRSIENRFAALFADIPDRDNTILFAENALETLRTPDGNIQPMTFLWPLLNHSQTRVIATATPAEYHLYMQTDRTISTFVQAVPINELSETLAVEILNRARERYEAHHRVTITNEAVAAAVTLSARHILGRPLPGKAMGLLDEAAAQVAMRGLDERPQDMAEYEEKLAQIRSTKESAIDSQDFEKAAALRDEEKKILAITSTRESAKAIPTVAEEDIAEALATIMATRAAEVITNQEDAQRAPAFSPSPMTTADDREIWSLS